ncbi:MULTISPECIES: hypothetical protein [unclassified Agarivorans]|uniref:hypothetical protein n=1 Tax=unclassified Agarivorans TaxID=2636026 RepID=UPI0010EC32FD|nr:MULTISPECIES: hypothetical protein [unclassified Agarivorans]MDO6686296.1 hypothetical protein [Agarivorans sp. 3_MG-2023]MDO6713598.1 hypothetical protein [Agarivorans sp. 2_MG-2023]MDO6761920.1 hypothetical protein [Agarivorans sp. 1_MG-2023]GDY25948.1 hypothetical protein AHAT_18380 [Agarivorans sp. Toyoura001]
MKVLSLFLALAFAAGSAQAVGIYVFNQDFDCTKVLKSEQSRGPITKAVIDDCKMKMKN